MRFKHNGFFHHNPILEENIGVLGIEGEEPELGGGGGSSEPEAPFSVGREDWERTQAELNELRGYKDKFGETERSLSEMREKFKPFLENAEKKPADAEPNPEDPKYGGDRSKYARDLVRWEARQEFKTQTQQQEASQREQQEAAKDQESQKQIFTKLTEADKRGVEKFPDYHQVIASSVLNLGQVPGLPQALAECDNPESIGYHFGKNPQEAYAFMNQVHSNPKAAMRTLILLDNRFTEAAKAPANPGREYKPTPKPGGKTGGGETMSERVKGAVWDEINGR